MGRGRSRCPECKTRSSWTKLSANGGKCIECDFDMGLATFRKSMREFRYNFTNETLERMYALSKDHNVPGSQILDLAVWTKLAAWEDDPKRFGQDMMLRKLSR